MAESKETSQEHSSVNDDETSDSALNKIKSGLQNGVDKKLVEEKDGIPDYRNALVTQEKNNILKTTTELQEIIINILQQKLKLSDLHNKHFMNVFSQSVEYVQKAADEAVKKFLHNSGEDIPEFQVIVEFLDNVKMEQEKEFTVNIDNFLEECHSMFLKYEELYKTSASILSNFLKNLEKVLKTNEVSKNSKLQERVLFSIFEEKLVSYNRILVSSKKAFDEFESLLVNDLKISEQDINKTINFLLTTFNKAEFAFCRLKFLAVEGLKIDFVKV